jgi:hypothetical protein
MTISTAPSAVKIKRDAHIDQTTVLAEAVGEPNHSRS